MPLRGSFTSDVLWSFSTKCCRFITLIAFRSAGHALLGVSSKYIWSNPRHVKSVCDRVYRAFFVNGNGETSTRSKVGGQKKAKKRREKKDRQDQ